MVGMLPSQLPVEPEEKTPLGKPPRGLQRREGPGKGVTHLPSFQWVFTARHFLPAPKHKALKQRSRHVSLA